MKIRIHVPATSANLGPGFDCLGLTLDWWNLIEVETIARGLKIEHVCDRACGMPRDRSNLVIHGLRLMFRHAHRPMPALRVRLDCDIPIGSGLGSSSAAIVGGMLAANILLGGNNSLEEMVTLATHLEGHPDNVAPALLGGIVIAAQEGKQVTFARFDVPRRLQCVVFVPQQALLTKKARGVLPRRVPRADAIYNASRTAMWIAALAAHRWDWLDVATRDRLHQPYRARLVPGMNELFDAARHAGACGVALSGAGPSIIAFTDNSGKEIVRALARAASRLGLEGDPRVVKISPRGAYAERFD